MADKNTRVEVEKERIGRPVDELVAGRTTTAADRPGDYTSSEVAGRSAPDTAGARTGAARTSRTPPRREPDADDRARELRAEIEATRGDMSETVDAIQDRLRPGTVASNAAESVRDMASERSRDIAESQPVRYARANPLPTVMVGVGVAGLAWLAFGGRDADDYRRGRRNRWRGTMGEPRYSDEDDFSRSSAAYRADERYDYGTYGDYDAEAGGSRARGGRAAADLKGRAAGVASDVRSRTEDASRRARTQARRARSALQRTWDENPLVIGAAAAVLGALVGMAIPETERENEWMGEQREDMIEGVQETVREKVEGVQQAATDAAEQVKRAAGLKEEG